MPLQALSLAEVIQTEVPHTPSPAGRTRPNTTSCVTKICQKIDAAVWQNPQLTQVHKIQEVVERFIESVLVTIRQINPKWHFSLIKCGSFYEGLRVGLPHEFDFMLEMKHFKVVTVSGSPDKMSVTLTTHTTDHIYNPRSHTTLQEYLTYKRDMVAAFKQAIEKNKRGFGFTSVEVRDHYNSPNMGLLFIAYKGKGIMIDLVPCLRFPSHCCELLPAYEYQTLNLLRSIIPQLPSHSGVAETLSFFNQHLLLVSTFIEGDWRVSTSVIENLLMNNLPSETKSPLRVIKYLCNMYLVHMDSYDVAKNPSVEPDPRTLRLFGYKQFIPTYILKLLFIQKVISLSQENSAGLFSCLTEDKYIEDILYTMLAHLEELHADIDIPPFLFSLPHGPKFKDLQPCNTTWYGDMVNKIVRIFTVTGLEGLDYIQLLNYPLLPGVETCDNNNGSWAQRMY